MTTFTLQDLNTVTPEEDEAFNDLTKQQALKTHEANHQIADFIHNRKIFDNIQPATKEQFMEQATNEVIQGATGAQYVVMDTTPKFEQHAPQPQHTPTVHELAQQLTESFALLIKAITELSNTQPQAQPVSEGLAEAVETVLQNAEWFNDNLNDTINSTIDDRIDEHDFSYEIEQAVENHFGDFCLEDYVDVQDLINDAVDDRLDDMVQEKVEEILQEKLQNITISFN
jgi:hypothetical protein